MTQQIFSPFAVSYFFGGDFIKRKIIAVMMAIVVSVSCFSINVSATSEPMNEAAALFYLAKYTDTDIHEHKFVIFKNILWGEEVAEILVLPKDFNSDNQPVVRLDGSFPTISIPDGCSFYRVSPRYAALENGNFSLSEDTYDDYFIRSDVLLYAPDGSLLNDSFSASIHIGSNGTELVGDVSAGQSELIISMGIYDSSGVTVGFNYVTGGKCNANEIWSHTFDLVSMRTELEDKDVDYDSLIGKLIVTDINGKSHEYTCSLDGSGYKEGLFSKKKEYLDYPDISDYLTPMPEFPGFDIEHPWQSLGNILKWIGDCVITLVKNLAGLFIWLKDSFFITIKNIGIALYNLVVDIRNMIEFLFIPDTKKMISQVSKSSPAMGELLNASDIIKELQGQVQDYSMTFTFLGEQCTFRIADYVPENLASSFRTFSSFVILSGGFLSVLNTFFAFLGMPGFAKLASGHVDDVEGQLYFH